MTVEHGRSLGGPSPYGADGDSVGSFAWQLREILGLPTGEMPFASDEQPRWDRVDERAFLCLVDMNAGLPFLDPSESVEGRDVADLFRHFRRFHAALPFAEGERHWLLGAYKTIPRESLPKGMTPREAFQLRGISDVVAGLAVTETVIISAGLRTRVIGRDLIRRWAAWRREADEFAGQGSLLEARNMLQLIGHELAPAEAN